MKERRGSWHVITGEYPPTRGGVADYSALVAEGLSELGWNTHAWAPGASSALRNGVCVHELPGRFDRATRSALSSALEATPAPRHLYVQYVPQALGENAVNLGMGHWLASRRDRGDVVHLMLHEPWVPYGGGIKRRAAAVATRMMAWSCMRGADHLHVSTPRWGRLLRSLAPPGARFGWLPIPSTIPEAAPGAAALARVALKGDAGAPVVGHFGTYGSLVAPLLERSLRELLARDATVRVLLIGSGAGAFASRLTDESRVQSSDATTAQDVAAAIAACDLVLQPYADGVSARRTTVMAALANSVAVVSNSGETTEPEWAAHGAVILTDGTPGAFATASVALLRESVRRSAVSMAGRQLYGERFALRHTIAALTGEQG
ncbi:MAG: hypothetical protein JWO05_1742 [Gemmatimonadetes bacterium]|nr:hypothetical protein [Gemmatimonadota bacterium]